MSVSRIWGMINRIAVADPRETLKRCELARDYLARVDCPELMTEDWRGVLPFDEMMETIAHIANDAYHRM